MSVKYDYAGRYVDGRAVRLVPNVNVHLERFAAYYEREPSWGLLHVVLADGNLRDRFLREVYYLPGKALDPEGEVLFALLAQMSTTQRGKIMALCGYSTRTPRKRHQRGKLS